MCECRQKEIDNLRREFDWTIKMIRSIMPQADASKEVWETVFSYQKGVTQLLLEFKNNHLTS